MQPDVPAISSAASPQRPVLRYLGGLLVAIIAAGAMFVVVQQGIRPFAHQNYGTAVVGGMVMYGLWAGIWLLLRKLTGQPLWYVPGYFAGVYVLAFLALLFGSDSSGHTGLEWLSTYLPFTPDVQDTVATQLYLLLSFVPFYAIEHSVRAVWAWRKQPGQPGAKTMVAVSAFGLAIILPLSLLSDAAGTALYSSRQRSLHAIQLPSAAEFKVSVSPATGRTMEQSSYGLYYPKAVNAAANRPDDRLTVTSLLAYTTERRVERICGGSHYSKGTYTYSALGDGFRYATAKKTGAAPIAGEATTTYVHCFVVGNFKYELERQDQGTSQGRERIAAYPAGRLIEAIRKGPAYVHGCYPAHSTGYRASYCRTVDTARLEQLHTAATKYLHTVANAPSPVPPAPVAVGTLAIKEWGISLPLTEIVKDAYYYVADDEYAYIGLPPYDHVCKAGVLTRSPNGVPLSVGHGIGMVLRAKTAELAAKPSYTPSAWKVIGDYSYSISTRPDLIPKCGISKETVNDLSKTLQWAESQLSAR